MIARKPPLLRMSAAQGLIAHSLLVKVEHLRAALESVTEARAEMIGYPRRPSAADPLGQGQHYVWTIPANRVASQIRRDLSQALRELHEMGIEAAEK